jgi:hypothetical protein
MVVLIAISISQMSFYDNTANLIIAKKYSNHFEQAASMTNECSGDHESRQICVNNNPQTQGKVNVVDTSITTPSGLSGPQGPQGPPGEQGPSGPAVEIPTGIITVTVEQICRPGGVPSPDPEFCEKLFLPPPSDFMIHVLSGNPTQPIPGTSVGTDMVIETGAYEVILLSVPPQPQSGVAHYILSFSEVYCSMGIIRTHFVYL